MLLFEAAIGFISPASRTLSKQYVQQKEALNALKEDRLTGSEQFLELEASMNDLVAWMTGKHKLHIKEGYRSPDAVTLSISPYFTRYQNDQLRERIRHVALLWFNKGLAFSGSTRPYLVISCPNHQDKENVEVFTNSQRTEYINKRVLGCKKSELIRIYQNCR